VGDPTWIKVRETHNKNDLIMNKILDCYIKKNGVWVEVKEIYTKVKGIDNGPLRVKIKITIVNTVILFPMKNTSDFKVDVNWGDGTTEVITDFNVKSHTYKNIGEYIIEASCDNVVLDFTTAINNFRKTLIEVLAPLPKMPTTSARSLFSNCKVLTTIPENLFIFNSQLIDFSMTFYDCAKLVSIPALLFSNNPNMTTVSACFYEYATGGIAFTIPDSLFDNNLKITNFHFCFVGRYKMKGIAPSLWLDRVNVLDGGGCFGECFGLSNYVQIPHEWKYSYR